jgi:hypothetical protein
MILEGAEERFLVKFKVVQYLEYIKTVYFQYNRKSLDLCWFPYAGTNDRMIKYIMTNSRMTNSQVTNDFNQLYEVLSQMTKPFMNNA